jgi:hypothetical protein
MQKDSDMKDDFASAYSDLIQNQIEFGSTLQSIIEEAIRRGVPADKIGRVRMVMESFDARTNCLARKLVTRYDAVAAEHFRQDQPAPAFSKS